MLKEFTIENWRKLVDIVLSLKSSVNTLETNSGSAGPSAYRAKLPQTAGNDPVPTVLENNLSGEIVWTRNYAGKITGTLAGAFPDESKITVNLNKSGSGAADIGGGDLRYRGFKYVWYQNDANSISLEIFTDSPGDALDGQYSDAVLHYNTYIEVLVFA